MRGARTAASLAAALALGLLCAVAAGASAGDALRALWDGAVGSRSALADTLNRATPLLLAGLAVSLAFRGGALNIGAEGQMLGGAAAATAAALQLGSAPPWVAIPAVLAAAAAGGALAAALAAVLRLRRGVPEVLSTILLNFAAEQLVSWLVRGPLQEGAGAYPQSDALPESARLPRLLAPTALHAGSLVSLAAAPLLWAWVFRTASGLRLRASGLAPEAARYAGFRPERAAALALVASGALAGAAGGIQVAGVTGRLYADVAGGAGYLAIAVALLGRLHPAGVVAAALFFAVLDAMAAELQRAAGVSAALAQVVQAAVLLGFLAAESWTRTARPAGGE